jgi:hypothetical protein
LRRFSLLCTLTTIVGLGGLVPVAVAQPPAAQAVTIMGEITGDAFRDRITLDAGGSGFCTVTTEAGLDATGMTFAAPVTDVYANPNREPTYCPGKGVTLDLGGDGTRELLLTWHLGSFQPDFDLFALRGSTVVGRFQGLDQPSFLGAGADFNGDGREDVWENSDQHATFQTFLNTADGQLVPGPAHYCDWNPQARFAFADFDLNGATDIVAGYRCGARVGSLVVFGDTGRQVDLVTGGTVGTPVPINHNGDALPDVRVAVSGYDRVFVNQGNGSFVRADSLGPTTTITAPAEGAAVAANTAVTVSGTASDLATGGGQVARVEVSEDGGATWRPATGTDSWTYSWVPRATGPALIRVRAVDDRFNVGAAADRGVTVGPQVCPCSVFGPSTPRATVNADRSSVEVGMRFTASQNVVATGARYYRLPENTGTHVASLWTATGQRLATGTFTDETPSGWQSLIFGSPVGLRAGVTYVVSYTAPNGGYAADSGYFATSGAGHAPLTAPAGGNGVYRFGSGFPTQTFNSTNYWVDVVVGTDGVDTTPPTVTGTTPAAGATDVPTDADVAATFSEEVDPESVRFEVWTGGGPPVVGTTVTDGATSTFVADELLAADSAYTVTLRATDRIGNPLSPARTWSFTTGSTTSGCPCTVFGGRPPARPDAGDGGDVELGVKFTSAVRTRATGVRFYKSAANTGTHTGSLWNAAGTRLATGTFVEETATGWQTLVFDTAVELVPGSTYVASYHAPNGHYAADLDYFATGAASDGPLTMPSSPAADGNGVFQYGGGFPSSSFRAANYWVDVVVDTAGLDNSPPVVSGSTPAAGATGVAPGGGVLVGFDERVDPASVSVTLTGPDGTVDGTARVSDDLRGVAFAPDLALAAATRYTVAVVASDIAGNAMAAPVTWVFTTGAADSCPCTLFTVADAPAGAGTGDPVELGMRWRSDSDGSVTSVRFYKTLGDTGTHTGSLWRADGTLLATGTFTDETAAGWQTMVFDTPVAVVAGTQYVVSYHGSAGRYGYTLDSLTSGLVREPLTAHGGETNGVYRYGAGGVFPSGEGGGRNYWVDVVFTR